MTLDAVLDAIEPGRSVTLPYLDFETLRAGRDIPPGFSLTSDGTEKTVTVAKALVKN